MSHNIRLYLLEDMVRHGMAEEALQIDLVQTDPLGNLSKGSSLINWK